MFRLRFFIGLLAFGLVACIPFQIENVKVSDHCLAWTTTQDAKCKVTFCDDKQCYITDEEPEYSQVHCLELPGKVHNIHITAMNKQGQEITQ